MRNKRVLLAIMLVVLFGVVGGTIAYYTSQDTFTNEFNTGKYVIKTQETFESPDNWIPGETTPKKVSVTNQGNVDAAVRVCYTEKWEDENGNSLPLYNGINPIAVTNFKYGYKNYWLEDCEDNNKKCFYYYKKLGPNETTEDLLESVTYNPDINFENTRTCTTDSTTHKITCINSVNDYSGGKYTLTFDIETVQYDQYENHFGSVVVEESGVCKNLNIMRSMPTHFSVIYRIPGHFWIKESELNDYAIDKNSCTVYYTDTISPENKYYKNCMRAYYVEEILYQPNQQVDIKPLKVRTIDTVYDMSESCVFQQDGSYICTNVPFKEENFRAWAYIKNEYSLEGDIDLFDNISSYDIHTWNERNFFRLIESNFFIMPNHNIFINLDPSK